MLTKPIVPRRRGFSLIEMLVVMTIMATLAGLGAGGYIKARNVAGKISCTNNLRQLYYPLFDYEQVNGQYPNLANLSSINPTGLPTLRGQFGDKTDGTGNGFHCPLDTKYFPTEGNSYEYNTRLATKSYQQALAGRGKSGKPKSPEKVTAFFDYVAIHSGKMNVLYLDGHVAPGP
jgi:prepilin-type N-terminal cleavage/methylation domain-containing protein/prepilin-type processing-associated H-X9-DG protein